MQDLILQFGINWRIIVAQMVNFSILFIVLRKFVYKPLIEFLDKRRKTIEDGIALQQAATSEFQRAQEQGQQIISESRIEAKTIIETTKAKAQQLGQELSQEARQKSEELILQGRSSFDRERALALKQAQKDSAEFLKKALKTILNKSEISQADERAIAIGLEELKKNI